MSSSLSYTMYMYRAIHTEARIQASSSIESPDCYDYMPFKSRFNPCTRFPRESLIVSGDLGLYYHAATTVNEFSHWTISLSLVTTIQTKAQLPPVYPPPPPHTHTTQTLPLPLIGSHFMPGQACNTCTLPPPCCGTKPQIMSH